MSTTKRGLAILTAGSKTGLLKYVPMQVKMKSPLNRIHGGHVYSLKN
jgi:hypothetical protein